jgi:hypothetical protein
MHQFTTAYRVAIGSALVSKDENQPEHNTLATIYNQYFLHHT